MTRILGEERTKDDNAGCAIPTLFILSTTQFDHILRRRMCNINFTEDRISIIC